MIVGVAIGLLWTVGKLSGLLLSSGIENRFHKRKEPAGDEICLRVVYHALIGGDGGVAVRKAEIAFRTYKVLSRPTLMVCPPSRSSEKRQVEIRVRKATIFFGVSARLSNSR